MTGAGKGVRYAPWTPTEVEALLAWQTGPFHPFTCANRGDGTHHYTTGLGVLTPTTNGWVCHDCDYTQDWAHGFMLALGERYGAATS